MRLLCIALLVIANTAFSQDLVKISGKIRNPLSDSIKVNYNDNRIAYYPKEYYGHINKKGDFSLSFPIPSGIYTQAEITHGNKVAEILLQAGDDLVMSVDAAHFDSTVSYKGKGSAIQNFIALHTIEKGRMNKYAIRIKENIHKEPADFLKSIEKERKAESDFLDRNKTDLPASFTKYWTAYYQYYNYFFMQQYPQMHEVLRLRRFTDAIPVINYSVVKDMPYAFNDTLLQVTPYLLYLTGVFETKLKASGYSYSGNDTARIRLFLDSVNNLGYKLLPDRSAEYFAAQNIYGRARYQPSERTEMQFGAFKSRWPHSEYLPLVGQQVSTALRLAKGQPAPDFDIVTNDGRKMKLSDLKGKVVYLGFWAGWCKQCVGEMLRERKIKDLINNKPLEFVYVSINNDTIVDNTIITKYKLDGVFTHVAGEWAAKEVALYGVQALPAYFLIDEDGKFALQNAPSPMQSTELILEMEKLFR